MIFGKFQIQKRSYKNTSLRLISKKKFAHFILLSQIPGCAPQHLSSFWESENFNSIRSKKYTEYAFYLSVISCALSMIFSRAHFKSTRLSIVVIYYSVDFFSKYRFAVPLKSMIEEIIIRFWKFLFRIILVSQLRINIRLTDLPNVSFINMTAIYFNPYVELGLGRTSQTVCDRPHDGTSRYSLLLGVFDIQLSASHFHIFLLKIPVECTWTEKDYLIGQNGI